MAEVADIIQIGARNMQNYSLLKKAGRAGKPILLKRGLAATIQELLLSAEYLLAEGNPRSSSANGASGDSTPPREICSTSAPCRWSTGSLTCPIIADPSHGTGHREMVTPDGAGGGGGRRRRAPHRGASRTRTRACPTARRVSIRRSFER